MAKTKLTSNIEIARAADIKPIEQIAKKLGIENEIEQYGMLNNNEL